MGKENNLVKVYTGSEMTVNLIQAELEEAGISVFVKNNFQLGLSAGFPDLPNRVEIFVNESDKETAESIVKDFTQNS